jgi:tetratricopeptide (TPR) repeat protein
MNTLTTTFDMPAWIAQGLADGSFERVGGVIRKVGGKQIVAWLRDLDKVSPIINFPVVPILGTFNLADSLANTGVSVAGFAGVDQRLVGLESQLNEVGKNLQQMQGSLKLTSAVSILNLGVSAIGFAVIVQRLNELERRLQKAQELLNTINRKIDLGFYVKFRAALDLAVNAFTMSKAENRRSSALAAINLFLEAEHIYTDFVDVELAQKSQIVDEYLLTLSLAYIAEARCYLELGEWDTALRRFQEGSEKIHSRIVQYVELLLTSNPAAYLHPRFKRKISLQRLTKIYQWLDPSLDENAVFELQRDNLFSLARDQSIDSSYKWVNSLPSAIVASAEVKGSIFGNREEVKQEAMKRLPQVFETMESMIETNYRFESYQTEVKAIAQLDISFHDWLRLSPVEPQPEAASLMLIVPSQPLELL